MRTSRVIRILYHERIHILLQVGLAQSSIPVVSDVASVHDFAEQVSQVLPRHF